MRQAHIIVLLLLTFNSAAGQTNFFERLADSALLLTQQQVTYDPAYRAIEYPNGDVAPDKGVCTDVIIRAYRKLGIDLQQEVHEDMKANFEQYRVMAPRKSDYGFSLFCNKLHLMPWIYRVDSFLVFFLCQDFFDMK